MNVQECSGSYIRFQCFVSFGFPVQEEADQRKAEERNRRLALAEKERLEKEQKERERKRKENEMRQQQDQILKDKMAAISQKSYGQKMLKKLDEEVGFIQNPSKGRITKVFYRKNKNMIQAFLTGSLGPSCCKSVTHILSLEKFLMCALSLFNNLTFM